MNIEYSSKVSDIIMLRKKLNQKLILNDCKNENEKS